jgi:fluoride ion exporter CrcB/FEX
LILAVIFVVVFGSYAAIHLSSTVLLSSSVATNKEEQEFDFLVTLFWSVTGALAGSWLGSQADTSKRGVQWGTFHVNMLSCILIGIAHNVLLLREFFPYGDSIYFAIVVQRFITAFCGSESSFAGLVDETAQLYNSHCQRKIVIRNLFYNLFLCMVVFLTIVFTVRFAFFYSVYY